MVKTLATCFGLPCCYLQPSFLPSGQIAKNNTFMLCKIEGKSIVLAIAVGTVSGFGTHLCTNGKMRLGIQLHRGTATNTVTRISVESSPHKLLAENECAVCMPAHYVSPTILLRVLPVKDCLPLSTMTIINSPCWKTNHKHS